MDNPAQLVKRRTIGATKVLLSYNPLIVILLSEMTLQNIKIPGKYGEKQFDNYEIFFINLDTSGIERYDRNLF